MHDVWVIGGIRQSWMPVFEYYTAQADAAARVDELVASEQRDFEEMGARVDLGVTWEQYREIQDLPTYAIDEVPHVESADQPDDAVAPSSGESTSGGPAGPIWLVLEDGDLEEDRRYYTTEEDAKDAAWQRRWARWEQYEAFPDSGGMTFAEFRETRSSARYDYAPAEPGPTRATRG